MTDKTVKQLAKDAVKKIRARVSDTFKNGSSTKDAPEQHQILEQGDQQQANERSVAAKNTAKGMWNGFEGNGKMSILS